MATLDHGRKEGLLLLVVFQIRTEEAVVHACSLNASLRPCVRTRSHSLTWRRRIRGGTSESFWRTRLLSPADESYNATLVSPSLLAYRYDGERTKFQFNSCVIWLGLSHAMPPADTDRSPELDLEFLLNVPVMRKRRNCDGSVYPALGCAAPKQQGLPQHGTQTRTFGLSTATR